MYFCVGAGDDALVFAPALRLSRAIRQPQSLRMMATITQSISHLVKVRSLEGEEKLNVIFDDSRGHHHEMLRDKEEHVCKTLKRISLSSMKHKGAGRKRKHTEVAKGSEDTHPPIDAHLYTPKGELVQDEVPNIVAWEEGSILELGSVKYRVCVNIPTVLSLKLPKHIMTGYPVVPEVTLEFSDFDSCQWEWLRHPANSNHTPSSTDLQLLGRSHTYWPSESDAGYKLLLKCTPATSNGTTGEPVTMMSPLVTESQKVTPITRRHLLTPARMAQPDAFRMVTYNTLAGVFTSDEYSHKILYPYCDPAALDIEYRRARIVQELIGYNADIFALQEVGTDCYEKFFLPALKDKGYDGCHMQKSGMIHEGEAIFFDTSKFSILSRESTLISDFLADDTSCLELHEGLKSAPNLLKEVMKKSSIILVAFLRSVQHPNNILMVANTHLYYHPKGDDVRLVQTAVMLNYLRTRLERISNFLSDEMRIATVIGGDMNSCPCIAAYEYLVSGHVRKEHQDWMVYKQRDIPRCQCYYKHNFGGGGGGEVAGGTDLLPHIQRKLNHSEPNYMGHTFAVEDRFRGMELKHGFHLHNVTGTEVCTNFTGGFKAVLDYIFIDSEQLAVERVVPLPSLEEVSEFVALPSVYFPSDHLALVADLKWK